MVIELGVVTAPTGRILLVDPGYLNLWCDDRRPVMPEGVLSSPEATSLANEAVDLEREFLEALDGSPGSNVGTKAG
jgi:hypothetical protein